MGTYAAVILHPVSQVPPTGLDPTEKALEVLRALINLGLIYPQAATIDELLIRDFQQWQHHEWSGSPGLWFYVRPDLICPSIASLVYTQTEFEVWEGKPPADVNADDVSLPTLEITVMRQAMPLVDACEGVLCRTWATVEFHFEDTRFHPDIHRVRDEGHPIFAALQRVFGAAVNWKVRKY